MAWSAPLNSGTGSASGVTGSPNLSTSAFASPLTPGSLIIVGVENTGTSTFTVTDTAGNTYVDCGAGSIAFNASAARLQLFIALNTFSTAANVVTMHGNPSTNFPRIQAAEFTGNASSSVVDVFASNANASSPGTGTDNATTTAAVTTVDGDLIIGWITPINGPMAAGTGFTQISSLGGMLEYLVQSTHGSIAATITDSRGSADPYGGILAAFKPFVAVGGTPRGLMLLGVG